MTVGELAQRLGVSFDRIDWWVRQGYLKPDAPHPGRGHYKHLSLAEAYVAQQVVRVLQEYGIEASPALFARFRA